jgi:purine-binding chemotaxis protein CheW
VTARAPKGAVDWAAVRERLARAERAGGLLDYSPAQARALLDERARLLARPAAVPDAPGELVSTMTFRLGAEHYAIDARLVHEVVRVPELTPLPGTPAIVAGLMHRRGEVLAVFDIRSFFGLVQAPLADAARVLVIGDGSAELGIVVDDVSGMTRVRSTGLFPHRPPAGQDQHYVRGVTVDAIIVLDAAALIRDPRLYVNQEDGDAP